MRGRFFSFFLIFLSLSILISYQLLPLNMVKADRGSIPSDPVNVYEPGQLAVVSWYDGREVIYLSSVLEVKADKEIKILEVLPLPSVPKIELGSKDVFEKLGELVENVPYSSVPTHGGGYPGGPGSGGEVIFNKVLGPHNVTVIKAVNSSVFVSMVQLIFEQNNVAASKIYVNSYIIDSYINSGYSYFAVDLISIKPSEGKIMVEPIIYKFYSPKIYYPMRISKLNKGAYSARIFFITSTIIPRNIFNKLKVSVNYYDARFYWKSDIAHIDSRLTEVFPFWKTYVCLSFFHIKGIYELMGNGDIIYGPVNYYDLIQSVITLLIASVYAVFLLLNKKVNKIFLKRNTKPITLYSLLIFVPLAIYWIGFPHIIISKLLPSMNYLMSWYTETIKDALMRSIILYINLLVLYFPLLSVLGLLFFNTKLSELIHGTSNISLWEKPIVISVVIIAAYFYGTNGLLLYIYTIINPYTLSEIIFTATLATIFFILVIAIFAVSYTIVSGTKFEGLKEKSFKSLQIILTLLVIYLYPTMSYMAYGFFTMKLYGYVGFTLLTFLIGVIALLVFVLSLITLRHIYARSQISS